MAGTFAVGALLAGCTLSPQVQPNGMPRVSRYTNTAQLDFLLSSYRTLAERAVTGNAGGVSSPTNQSAQPANELLDDACLGWERAVFDLQSARRYPVLLRLSTESANLAALWHDLPVLAQRSPRPEACGPSGEPGQPVKEPEKGAPPVPTGELPREALLGQAAATPPSSAEGSAAAPAVAQAQAIVPPPSAMPVTGIAPTSPASGAASSAATVVVSDSKSGAERRALAQLRGALGMPITPPAQFAAAYADPSLPLPTTASVDLPTLRALADSEIPTIRLRARFHLLGLCTLAVEATDRFGQAPSPARSGSTATPALTEPTDPAVCGELRPGDSLRDAQRRQLTALLRVWRSKYPEPMSDLVIALANFASRDNPVVDGPRVAR